MQKLRARFVSSSKTCLSPATPLAPPSNLLLTVPRQYFRFGFLLLLSVAVHTGTCSLSDVSVEVTE